MFVFQVGDESWKKKRTACAHAFYKDRLAKMMDVMKDKLNAWIDKRNAEIDANPDNETVVDIGFTFEKLFCRNIIHICFGEDVSDMQIEMDFRKSPGSSEFLRRSVTISEAIHEFDDSIIELAGSKWLNPIYQAIRSVTGIKNLTSYQATIAANG